MNIANLRTYLLLAAGLLAVSTSSIFIRWTGDTPALVIALYRLVIAGVILSALARFRGDPLPRLSGAREIALLLTAGLALALHFATWIASLKLTTVSSSVMLVSTSPVWAAVISRIVLKESLTRRQLAGISFAVGGSSIIAYSAGGAGESSAIGNALALAGGITGAVYLSAGRILRRTTSTFSYAGTVYLIAAVFIIIPLLIRKEPLTGYSFDVYILLLLIALLPQLVGHTTFNWALKKRSAVTVAVVMTGEPVGATLLAMALLSEFPGAGEMSGGVLLLTGIYMSAAGETNNRG